MYPHHVRQEIEGASTLRDIDWNRYSFDHVAFKVAYLGWPYQGFASQNRIKPKPDVTSSSSSSPPLSSFATASPALVLQNFNTIEEYLFSTFKQARLIRDHPSLCNYSRCGRTDSGVSATSQVIAMTVRTTDIYGKPLPLMTILNRLLPDYIQVVDWSPVPKSFNARFDCKWREYHYNFPFSSCSNIKNEESSLSSLPFDHDTLDIESMKEAAKLLVGFNNMKMFSKKDPSKPETPLSNWHRHIYQSEISVTVMESTNDETKEMAMRNNLKMACFRIRGSAFLYHQVRCTMALLLQVGRGEMTLLEFQRLLNPPSDDFSRPVIQMADPEPLVLYNVSYGDDMEWNWKATIEEKNKLSLKIQRLWGQYHSQAMIMDKLFGF